MLTSRLSAFRGCSALQADCSSGQWVIRVLKKRGNDSFPLYEAKDTMILILKDYAAKHRFSDDWRHFLFTLFLRSYQKHRC